MNKEKIAQAAIEKGINSLVILEGKAPEQYNDSPVIINGNIDAPSRFIEGRKDEFQSAKKHCVVSKSSGKITLILNEQSVVDKYTIEGKIEVAKKFSSLGINNSKTAYSPEDLANKFKLLRSIFVSNLEHAQICATLRNLKAKVNSQIEEKDDRRGNVTANFRQTVESNMPDSIKLNVPLLEGEDPVVIEVNVVLEANGSEIVCYLESVEAAEMIEKQFELRVEQEVEKIKDFVTVIFY